MTNTAGTDQTHAQESGTFQSTSGPWHGYSSDEYRPLGAYSAITGVYNLVFASLFVAARGRQGSFAPTVGGLDMILFGVATHKLSRLITKDFVTSFLRAPFTRYEGHGDAHAEVQESPRGRGMRYALGELLTCPYCVAQWVAPAFWFGSLVAPAPTRLVSRVFTTVALADVLHLAYLRATKEESSK